MQSVGSNKMRDNNESLSLMDITDPKIVSLRKSVEAARQEFDMAVMFHESWKPAAYDESLHQRMGNSYATHTFNIVRIALRREMMLALMRLWDARRDTLRLEHIARTLRDPVVIDALATDRAPFPEAKDQMMKDLAGRASEAIALIEKYSKGGSSYSIRHKLQSLRHERLAHRDMAADAATGPSATDEEIETFYRDNSEIVRLLLGAVNAMAYNPAESADVFRHYATHFWGGARGEQTEGHPNFQARNSPTAELTDPQPVERNDRRKDVRSD